MIWTGRWWTRGGTSRDIKACHDLGCSSFITKPVDYDRFVETIRALGHFLGVVTIPPLAGERPVPGQADA